MRRPAAQEETLERIPADFSRPARGSGIERYRPEDATSDSVPLKPARVLSAMQAAFPDAFWFADQGASPSQDSDSGPVSSAGSS